MTDSTSFYRDGRWRLPWPKPPPAPEWRPPEWFNERMYGHPLYKYAHRIELEHFARTGRVMKPATLAKRIQLVTNACYDYAR